MVVEMVVRASGVPATNAAALRRRRPSLTTARRLQWFTQAFSPIRFAYLPISAGWGRGCRGAEGLQALTRRRAAWPPSGLPAAPTPPAALPRSSPPRTPSRQSATSGPTCAPVSQLGCLPPWHHLLLLPPRACDDHATEHPPTHSTPRTPPALALPRPPPDFYIMLLVMWGFGAAFYIALRRDDDAAEVKSRAGGVRPCRRCRCQRSSVRGTALCCRAGLATPSPSFSSLQEYSNILTSFLAMFEHQVSPPRP